MKTPNTNGRRMCSVLIILYLLYKLYLSNHLQRSDINIKEILGLFSMLYLRPDISKCSCTDLKFLQSYIPDDFTRDVGRALIYFINIVLPSSQSRLDWVCVIPLIHFFMGKALPFDAPETDSKKLKWFDQHIVFATIKSPTAVEVSR